MVPQGKYACSRDSVCCWFWEFGAGKPEMDLFVFNFLTTLLSSSSVMNEVTQDKVGVFWESALWEGLHLFYWRISISLLDKYVKNSKTF